MHESRQCYKRFTPGWFIWWDGIDTWTLSIVKGVEGTDYWTRTDPAIEGVYAAGGTATGEATVSEVV